MQNKDETIALRYNDQCLHRFHIFWESLRLFIFFCECSVFIQLIKVCRLVYYLELFLDTFRYLATLYTNPIPLFFLVNGNSVKEVPSRGKSTLTTPLSRCSVFTASCFLIQSLQYFGS